MTDRKLQDIMDSMEEQEVLEDRREYTAEDLRRGYGLTDREAEDLYAMIQRQFDPEVGELDPQKVPSWIHKEYYLETVDGGYEGFSDHEIVILWKWQDDLCRYWNSVKDDVDRDPVTGRPLRGTYGSKEADQ